MTAKYQPPVISGELGRTTLRAADDRNFFARGSGAPTLPAIDGVPVASLVEQFGSPLFVFSERVLRDHAAREREAFRKAWPETRFFWSYKTNYLGALCQIFHGEGWGAEVVSEFEYDRALSLGVPGSAIVLNGPWKSSDLLARALADGALVQIDNWDELIRIEDLATDAAEPLEVGIRVWMDTGIRPIWSKFGFALANGEAERAAARVIRNPRLRLRTLHTHIGTYILAPEAYRVATQKLVGLRDQLRVRHGHVVPCLNLGGGFASPSLLHGMVGPAEHAVPPIEAYAEAITGVLGRLPEDDRPALWLETGRHLVDDAGTLLATVVAVKGMSRPALPGANLTAREYKEHLVLDEEARTGYVIDAGVNLLYTAAWFEIAVLPARPASAPPAPSRLYGPLCMSIDVIRDHVDLPPLTVGDIVALHPVGAYNLAQSMQFIEYRPAVVLLGPDGRAEVIRARETLADMTGPERIPARFSGG